MCSIFVACMYSITKTHVDEHYPIASFRHNVRPASNLFGQMQEMVGKCPMSDHYFKLCSFLVVTPNAIFVLHVPVSTAFTHPHTKHISRKVLFTLSLCIWMVYSCAAKQNSPLWIIAPGLPPFHARSELTTPLYEICTMTRTPNCRLIIKTSCNQALYKPFTRYLQQLTITVVTGKF